MGAVIRSAQWMPERTRLGDARPATPDAAEDPAPAPSADAIRAAARERMRAELEPVLRAELAAQARELHDNERRRGHAEGMAQGLAEGKAAAAKELAQQLEQLATQADQLLANLGQAHRQALLELENSVGEVAFAAVCRLLGSRAALQDTVLSFVERACEPLHGEHGAAGEVSVRLHPRDVALLRPMLDTRGRSSVLRLKALALKVVPDSSLEFGGCVIETGSGYYAGDLEGQLRRLHQVLCGQHARPDRTPAREAGQDAADAPAPAADRTDGRVR